MASCAQVLLAVKVLLLFHGLEHKGGGRAGVLDWLKDPVLLEVDPAIGAQENTVPPTMVPVL